VVVHSATFVFLACTFLIGPQSVTDGQTDHAWLRRAKHSAVARKNRAKLCRSIPTV